MNHDNAMSSYRLEFWKDHAIVCFGSGARFLLDTGSPMSMGPIPTELGHHAPLPFVGLITPEYLMKHTGARVDGLLGCDILFKQSFEVDWVAGTLRIGSVESGGNKRALPLRRVNGIPVVEFEVEGTALTGYLDSGAPISYLDPSIPLSPPARREDDFHPILGCFATETGQRTVQIVGESVTIKQGWPPGELVDLLKALAPEVTSILGADLFRKWRIAFDLNAPAMLFRSRSAPPC
jgi:hypothetical protein